MSNEIHKDYLTEKLDKNLSDFAKYFEFNLEVFCEFNTVIFEINQCLIFELHRASLTLTNHLLERLLKLALIQNDTGIDSSPVEEWNDKFSEPNRKYGAIDLGNSIELCKKKELITQSEKDVLFDTVRSLMRNGFSHADSSKILANIPDESKIFQGSFSNPNGKLKEASVNQKVIPVFQALQMEAFAKNNSISYFDFVFKLVFKIEKRLIKKHITPK